MCVQRIIWFPCTETPWTTSQQLAGFIHKAWPIPTPEKMMEKHTLYAAHYISPWRRRFYSLYIKKEVKHLTSAFTLPPQEKKRLRPLNAVFSTVLWKTNASPVVLRLWDFMHSYVFSKTMEIIEHVDVLDISATWRGKPLYCTNWKKNCLFSSLSLQQCCRKAKNKGMSQVEESGSRIWRHLDVEPFMHFLIWQPESDLQQKSYFNSNCPSS